MSRLHQLGLALALTAGCGGETTPLSTEGNTTSSQTGAGGETATSTETMTDSETTASMNETTTSSSTSSEICTIEKLKEMCGYNLNVILREDWGDLLKTQNDGVILPSGNPLDTSNPDRIIEAITTGTPPPYIPWPQSEGFPSSYNVGNELNAQGYNWPTDELDWPVVKQPLSAIDKLVVHYTAGDIPPNGDCQDYMRQITNFHTFERGWGDIGYQLVVCDDGSVNVYQGRSTVFNPDQDPETNSELKDTAGQWVSIQSVGAHVDEQNTGKVGVSLALAAGQEPNPDELETYTQTIACIALETGVFGQNIVGHKDLAATECPGALYPHLDEIRTRVDECLKCRVEIGNN